MLWKNLIITSAAFAVVAFILLQTEADGRHRLWLKYLAGATVAMLVVLMTPVPYSATMAILVALLAFLIMNGVPAFPAFLLLTAVTPMLEYYAGGVAGIGVLLKLSAPLFAGFAILALRLLVPQHFVRPGVQGADVAVILFVAIYVYMMSRGHSFVLMLRQLTEFTLILVGGYIAASRTRLPGRFFLLKAFAFVGGALALISIFEAVRIWPQFTLIPWMKGIAWTRFLDVRVGAMRSLGPFTDPITFSLFLSSCFIAVWGMWAARYKRKLSAALGILILVGLICTFSRTGGVALLGGMATFMLVRRKFPELLALAAIAVGGLYLNSLLPENVREGSTSYRVEMVPVVLKVVAERPLTGDNHAIASGKLEELRTGQGIVDIVNTYLGLLLDGGIVLLLAFLAIPLVGIVTYARIRRRYREPEHLVPAQVALAQMMGMLVGLVSTSPVDKNLVYVIAFAGLLTAVLANAALAARTRAAGPAAPRREPDGAVPEPIAAEIRLPQLR